MDPRKPETAEVKQEDAKELDLKEVEQVDGAGNPFDNVPRVPLHPIDDKLRENG